MNAEEVSCRDRRFMREVLGFWVLGAGGERNAQDGEYTLTCMTLLSVFFDIQPDTGSLDYK